MVTLIFKFDPIKGQLQVKLGQIRSNFKIFLQNMPNMCRFFSGTKNVIYFYVGQLEMGKNCISKMWHHHLYLFLGHCTGENKDIALKFCMWLFVCISITYIPGFGITWKFRILKALFLKKKHFGGQNRKHIKNPIAIW